MGVCDSLNKKHINVDEIKGNDKNKKKDYNPEKIIQEEKRTIIFNEINRIQRKSDTIYKILKEK